MRLDYQKGSLEEQVMAENPMLEFHKWFENALAAEISEPNAMTLATCVEGQPSARIVLLKGVDEKGFVFYTNYEGRKAKEMAENPLAALLFFWGELEQQIRIEGSIEKISPEESDTYYQSRDRGSRIGAWASPQSAVIPNREYLAERVKEFETQFADKETIERPPHWGGYRLVPHRFEFWQGRSSRLHDRIVYTKNEAGVWEKARLAP